MYIAKLTNLLDICQRFITPEEKENLVKLYDNARENPPYVDNHRQKLEPLNSVFIMRKK